MEKSTAALEVRLKLTQSMLANIALSTTDRQVLNMIVYHYAGRTDRSDRETEILKNALKNPRGIDLSVLESVQLRKEKTTNIELSNLIREQITKTREREETTDQHQL